MFCPYTIFFKDFSIEKNNYCIKKVETLEHFQFKDNLHKQTMNSQEIHLDLDSSIHKLLVFIYHFVIYI